MTSSPQHPADGIRPKAYSYRRFSTAEQRHGDSLARQTRLAASYAARHGLELDTELSYQDLGLSAYRGGNVKVGMLGEFLDAVDSGQVPKGSFLLVENLDRISRDTARRALRVLEDIVDKGINVVTLNDEQVYSQEALDNDPTKLMLSLLGFLRANEESATKSRRLKEAWVQKRAEAGNRPMTSRAPAWLRLDKVAGRFEVIEDRAEMVRQMFADTLDGKGQHKIADELNKAGVRPWGRGAFWHRSYISKILRNPSVCGIYTPHVLDFSEGKKSRKPMEPLDGYYPSIVAPEVFAEVQRLDSTSQAPTRGRHSNAPLSNVLGGMALCPDCGGKMTRVHKGKKSVPHLVCAKAKAGAGCGYHSVKYDWVHSAIVERLPAHLADIPAGQGHDSLEGQIVGAVEAVDRLKAQARKLLDEWMGASSNLVADRLREVEGELDVAQAELVALLERREALSGPTVAARVDRLAEALTADPLDILAVNLALRKVFARVVVNWRTGVLELSWAQGGEALVPFALGQGAAATIKDFGGAQGGFRIVEGE